MNPLSTTCAAILALAIMSAPAHAADTRSTNPESAPRKASSEQVARGRYMLVVGSCNDCHTAEFAPREGNVPEKDWLLGSGPLGFRGPWGTTYAPNLRLTLSKLSEDQWVKYARALKTRPPMPWFNLNQWTEPDLRAFYQYVKQLGPVGGPALDYLPPSKQPPMPYIQWPAPPAKPEGAAAKGDSGKK
jgi:mono/diheme cytochrome c family protein